MKRILVAPLDWGLGHATRCIPLIQELQLLNCEVLIGGSGSALALLQKEFPALPTLQLPAYDPTYPAKGSMVWKMARQLPHFSTVIRKEHAALQQAISSEKIDGVISDNRFGCWSDKVPCIFITHQSNIMMPQRFGWLAPWVRRMTWHYMKKYTECWIPDSNQRSLTGELSAATFDSTINVSYIGPISRFHKCENIEQEYDVVAVLSGPEPQRTLFEEVISRQLSHSTLKYRIVRGLPNSDSKAVSKSLIDFLTTSELQSMMAVSKIVIARSGYSTVMDMAALGKRVIFVPTPGQTEQAYLARHLEKNRLAYYMEQSSFDLSTALKISEDYKGFSGMDVPLNLFKEKLKRWVSELP